MRVQIGVIAALSVLVVSGSFAKDWNSGELNGGSSSEPVTNAPEAAQNTPAMKPYNPADDPEPVRIERAEKTNPNCSAIRFSGRAVGSFESVEQLWSSEPFSRQIARAPLQCGLNAYSKQYLCDGFASFENQRGFLIAWTDNWLRIYSPVEFRNGIYDVVLFVDRKSARCMDHLVPSAAPWKNTLRFFGGERPYR